MHHRKDAASMPKQTDYSDTRTALVRVIDALDRARLATAQANLPPRMPPSGARAQIDAVQIAIEDALEELGTARDACVSAGRPHLRICD